jgi:hypothetical protein
VCTCINAPDLKGAVNVQFVRMQIRNEKEHQEDQKKQGQEKEITT